MIVNQWVPAAHRGDAIGDSARRVRDTLRALGHASDIYALTIDDDMRDEVRPFASAGAPAGDVTIFHYALPSPMTPAFAALPRGRVLQYHNITPPHFFAGYEPGVFRITALGTARSAIAGRRDRPGAWRLRVQPARPGAAGISADRGVPDCVEPRAHHRRGSASRSRPDPERRADQLPLRRPHRAEQARRGHRPAGRGLQAIHRYATTASSSSVGQTAFLATTRRCAR